MEVRYTGAVDLAEYQAWKVWIEGMKKWKITVWRCRKRVDGIADLFELFELAGLNMRTMIRSWR